MSAIVVGLLNALIGLILQILAAALEFFADTFLTTVEWNFNTFGQYIPFFANFLSFFKVLAAGWLSIVGLLFVLKCFGLAVGLQINRSKMWQFVLRYIFFGMLAIKSWGLMSFIYLSLVSVIDDVMATNANGDLEVTSFITDIGIRVADGLFTGVSGAAGAMLGIVKVVILLVVAIMLVINFFNLIKIFFVRYIRLVFLVALAPIAFGMAILEETKEIFNTYIRTFLSDMFVFITTALFIKGFISVIASSSNRDFDSSVEFADIAYGDLIWAFFAMAYSSFAVQFDQFLASLGVNISRGGSTGGGFLSALGTSALLLRNAVGRSIGGGGISTPLGSTFSQNWNNLKSSVLGGARAGFAAGGTPTEAMAMGAMGAAKGFTNSTNIAKAAEMTKDGSLTAAALNERFANMQAAAGHNMSQKEYDAVKKRADENGLDFDKQRERDAILQDMRTGNLTPEMAQNKLAARDLLTDEEMAKSSMPEHQSSTDSQQADVSRNMAEEYQMSGNTPDSVNFGQDGEIDLSDGININPNETLRTSDSTVFYGGNKTFPDGTQVSPDGTITFGNGAVMGNKIQDVNGNTLPIGAMKHTDGTITSGNKIYSPDGSVQTITESTTLPDGTTLHPNGVRSIGEGDNQVIIGSKGSISHGNGAITKNGITTHANGSQSFSDGSVRMTNGNIAHLDGSVTNTNGSTTLPDGSMIFPDGSVLHSNGDTTQNGVTKHTDHSTTFGNRVEHGNGSISYMDGRVSNPDGSIVDGKGFISYDNGKNYQPIIEPITHPNGDISYPNGSVYHASSGITSNDGGIVGRVVHAPNANESAGVVSIADGSVFWSNGTASYADKSVEFDGGITAKGNTVLHSSGTKTVTVNNITKVIRQDGYLELEKNETEQQQYKKTSNKSKRGKRTIFTGRKR